MVKPDSDLSCPDAWPGGAGQVFADPQGAGQHPSFPGQTVPCAGPPALPDARPEGSAQHLDRSVRIGR